MVADISLTTSYSLWFIPLCILLGLAFSLFSYFRNKLFNDVAKWKVATMILLRTLIVALIAFLLLNPVINTSFRNVENPIVIIAQDRSTSMLLNSDSATITESNLKLDELAGELAKLYDVKKYSFGNQVTDGFSTDYMQKETDFSALLKEIDERHMNRNVGALIIVSDGIYNKGSNPLYGNYNFDFPLYTVAMGDTSRKRDVILKKATHNKIAYLGNKFPLRVDVSAHEANGESITATVFHQHTKLAAQQATINGANTNISFDFLLEAVAPGLQLYEISISTINGETNTSNNKKSVFIEVLDGRQNILILSNAPHPDVGAIKSSLSVFDNYKVEISLANEFKGAIDRYDLIILNQLPAAGQQQYGFLDNIRESNIACLYILGGQSSLSQFNNYNTGLKINGNVNKLNEVQPVYQNDFSLFRLNETIIEKIGSFPPLSSPFGEYQTTADHSHLVMQRIGLVESNNPLITFIKKENKKTGIICGEGLWRWKLWNYQKTQKHDHFNDFIGKIVQYLSVKDDKSRLRISSKNTFYENESISFDAEFYNEAYELNNKPEIEMVITDSTGKKFPFIFNRTTNAYTLNAGTLPVGNYKYEAKVKAAGNALEKKGVFSVLPLLIESLNTIADHELLFKLSSKHNGEMVNINQLEKLKQLITDNEEIRPVAYNEEIPLELIHLKWIFFLLLVMLALEWFMRKRNGAY